MKKHQLKFRSMDRQSWDDIRQGRKTIETRAATVKYRDIAAGDVLVLACGSDKFEKTVISSRHFASVEDLLALHTLKSIMPSAQSPADLHRLYAGFPGYGDKIKQHGLMAFQLT